MVETKGIHPGNFVWRQKEKELNCQNNIDLLNYDDNKTLEIHYNQEK